MPKNRIERERQTIRVMSGMFCCAHHGSHDGLCPDCQTLHDYAMQRIDHCPLIEDKPTCARCPIHCYRKDMRFAGPRRMFSHPILTIMHYVDEMTKQDSESIRKSR